MEDQNQNSDSGLFGLSLDPIIRTHLSETARWGKFLAIVGFIMCGLLVIGGLILSAVMPTLTRTSPYDSQPAFAANLGPTLVFVYIIIAVIYLFPCLFLLRFSNRMKLALAADNQSDLALSFQNLKALFRYVGILTIIVLSLYVLALLGGILTTVGR